MRAPVKERSERASSPKAFVWPKPKPGVTSKSDESSIPSVIVTAMESAECLSYKSDQPQLVSTGIAESAASWRKIKT